MQVLPNFGTVAQILPISGNSAAAYSSMAYLNNSASLPYMLSQAATLTSNPVGTGPGMATTNSAVALLNVSNLLNQKDSRWLQLEVCREFQRNKCTRSDTECKFAHPAPHVEIQNGRVTACYDSIKGRCNRDKPPCKYFHPPQHLKDQLLINGRNHLALKNALMQQMGYLGAPMIHSPVTSMNSPYVSSSLPPMSVYSTSAVMPPAYLPQGQMMQLLAPATDQNTAAAVAAATAVAAGQQVNATQPASTLARQASAMHGALVQQQHPSQQALTNHVNVISQGSFKTRCDKFEVCREFQRGVCSRSEVDCRFAHPPESVFVSEDGFVTVCMDHEKGRCTRDPCRYYHKPEHLKCGIQASTPTSSPIGHSGQVLPPNTMPAEVRTSVPNSIMTIPNNIAAYKRGGMIEKTAGMPIYQPMAASETAQSYGPPQVAPVQTAHPSVYHQAILQHLQQQQAAQQGFLPPTYATAAPMTIPRFP